MQLYQRQKFAGFWIRLIATWVDCIIIYLVLDAIFYLLAYKAPSVYFPFNFIFFITGIIYAVIFIGWKGYTPGKFLFDIQVTDDEDNPLPLFKAVLRETIFKLLSGIVLMLGFCWIGFSRKKKGWHDFLAGSKVSLRDNNFKGQPFIQLLAALSFMLASFYYCGTFISPFIEAHKVALDPASVRLPFMERNPSAVTNVAAVKDSSFVPWLNEHAVSADEYAIKTAAAHPVTIFGEMHEKAECLEFFNHIIPDLYRKAGVRVLAMEVIASTLNNDVEKLVTAPKYDSLLALKIARHQSWGLWGFKEYWDVLKSVWAFNKQLSPGEEKLRLIGLDCDVDMANVSLLGLENGDSKGKPPFQEKFRIFSAIHDIPLIALRDKLMALEVEREIIDKKKKAVIWIGYNHTMKRLASCKKINNQWQALSPRFGMLLNERHPNTFFQVQLYQHICFNEENTTCKASIDSFMDSVMHARNNVPAGFTITGSPFEMLRDDCTNYFQQYPSACYGDIADGLIFLKANNESRECSWMPGYVDEEMFMRNKALYNLIFGSKQHIQFKNADHLNKMLVQFLSSN